MDNEMEPEEHEAEEKTAETDDTLPAEEKTGRGRGLLLTLIQLAVCLLFVGAALIVRLIGGEPYAKTATWFFEKYNSSVFTDARLPLLPYRDEVSFSEESTIAGGISGKQAEELMKGIRLASPVDSPELLRAFDASEKSSAGRGIALAAKNGEAVYACLDGEVTIAERDDSLGEYIVLSHDNRLKTVYGNCSRLLVKKGDKVSAGQRIALAGQSGSAQAPQLYFGLTADGVSADPAPYLDLKSSNEA